MIILMEYIKKPVVQICLVVLIAIGAFASGRFSQEKPRIQIQEKIKEIKIVDQLAIEKAVETAKIEWSKNIKAKVVTKVVTKPDGEKTEETMTETETAENSKSEVEVKKETEVTTKEVTQKESQIVATFIADSPKYLLGVSIHKEIPLIFKTNIQESLDYSIDAGMKIAGPIWVTANYRIKSKEVGLGISFQF